MLVEGRPDCAKARSGICYRDTQDEVRLFVAEAIETFCDSSDLEAEEALCRASESASLPRRDPQRLLGSGQGVYSKALSCRMAKTVVQ